MLREPLPTEQLHNSVSSASKRISESFQYKKTLKMYSFTIIRCRLHSVFLTALQFTFFFFLPLFLVVIFFLSFFLGQTPGGYLTPFANEVKP